MVTIDTPAFIDPAIERKSAIVDENLRLDQQDFPLPSVIEISESGTCNRVCSFCPRSAPGYPDIKEFIAPELLEKLTSQLAEAGFKGLVLFSGFVKKNHGDWFISIRQISTEHPGFYK